jgi:drug/metabolite transporter (DMT)-like permease
VLVTGIIQDGVEGMNAYGVSCGVLAAVFYTAMVLFNKKLTSIGSYDRTVVQLGVAAVVVMAYSLFTVDFGELRFDAQTVVLLLVMGALHTGIAFTLYFGSLAYLEASSAVIYGYIEPIIGLALSVLVLGEDLGWIGWMGAALILGSTFSAEIIERRRPRRAQPQR